MHATTWKNLKSLMLSEKTQSQKVTYYMISFIQHSKNDKTIEMEIRLLVSRGQGGGPGRPEVGVSVTTKSEHERVLP